MAGKNTANQGTANQGAANQGAANQGTANQGAANQGAANQGTADKGAANKRTVNQGAAGKSTEKELAGWKIVAETEEDRKLRRRANRIRKAMLQDLQARGLTAPKAASSGAGSSSGSNRDRGAIYADMVEDYVALWITRERLEADIAERGVTVFDEKRGLPVENCSVSARVRVSKQMTTIMQTLGYKDQAIKARRPEGDADDDL